jgi:hypothetical protein
MLITSKKLLFFLIFTIIQYLTPTNQLSYNNAKKISFLNKFKEYNNGTGNKTITREKYLENYIRNFEKITRDNQLTFKILKIYGKESFQPFLKNKKDISNEGGIKLFRIGKEHVINMEKLKENKYWNSVFKYIKGECNILYI